MRIRNNDYRPALAALNGCTSCALGDAQSTIDDANQSSAMNYLFVALIIAVAWQMDKKKGIL